MVAHKKSFRSMEANIRRQMTIGKKFLTKFYLLDSSNIEHLSKMEVDIADLVMERVREKIKLGLKATG